MTKSLDEIHAKIESAEHKIREALHKDTEAVETGILLERARHELLNLQKEIKPELMKNMPDNHQEEADSKSSLKSGKGEQDA